MHVYRHYTIATWRAIADQLRSDGNSFARRGLRLESQRLYRLGREIETNIRAGIEKLAFADTDLRRIDRGFSRCCGVVEDQGQQLISPDDGPAAIDAAERILRDAHAA